MRFLRRFIPFLVALVGPGFAHALSIGEMKVESALGEPLDVRIAVRLEEGLLPQQECFQLAGASRFHPALTKANVALVSRGGARYVSITTRVPVNDPILDLTLRTEDCGVTMQRDFVVLLTPRELLVAPPVTAATAAAPAKRAERPKERRAEAKKSRPKARATGDSTRSGGRGKGAAAKVAGGMPVPFVFRLDYDHDAFAIVAERVAKERAAGRGPGAAAGAAGRPGAAPGAALPAAGDRLVLQPLPAGVGSAGEAGGGLPSEGVAGGVAPADAQGGVNPAGGKGGVVGPVPPADAKGKGTSWSLAPNNLLILLALLLLAVAIALWLKFRAPASRFMDKTQSVLAGLHPADPSDPQRHPLVSRNLPPVDEAFGDRPSAKSAVAAPDEDEEARVPPKVPAADAATPPPPADTFDADLAMDFNAAAEVSVDTADSPESVLELAEVMLAFGRAGQAVETLDYYIRNHPRQGVEPWLKLLDLYYQSGQRAEFETLSTNLHNSFNVAIPDWASFERDRADGEPAEFSLESLHHIMARLTALWGTAECRSYLDSLIADNRGGHRAGFALPIIRDILLLRDIARLHDPTGSGGSEA